MKQCKLCGKDISDRANNAARYCLECAKLSRLESVRKSKQKMRQLHRDEVIESMMCRASRRSSTMQQLYNDAREATRLGMSYGEYVAKKGGRRNG